MTVGVVIFHRLIVPPDHAKSHLGEFRLLINRHYTNNPVPRSMTSTATNVQETLSPFFKRASRSETLSQ